MLEWPAAHIRLISKFLKREPTLEARIEILLARIAAEQFNAHRKKEHWRDPDFYLIASDAWPDVIDTSSDRYTDADRKTMASLMNIRKIK